MKLLSQRSKRKGVLVPLLEDLFTSPVEIEDEHDIAFLTRLFETMAVRQKDRISTPLYSPSQLASCLRYVYLLKHHEALGIARQRSVRVQPNFYFFNGNFLHVKWQFALHKLNRRLPNEIFQLIGVEVPIVSKRKDHGGTVDGLALVYGEPLIVDFKGLNVRTFSEITRGFVPPDYAVQLSDYGMLYNSARVKKVARIERALLIVENKGGPDQQHIIALHETEIAVSTYLPEVRLRLESLRENEADEKIPAPECRSPYIVQYTGCAFRKFCKSEVVEIYKAAQAKERNGRKELTVAIPSKRAVARRRK